MGIELSTFAGAEGTLFLAPIIFGLVQLVKWKYSALSKGDKGLLSFGFGLLLGLYLTFALQLNPWEQMWWGGAAGLVATGGYKFAKRASEWKPKA